MPALDDSITVTIPLPKRVYVRATRLAAEQHRSVEEQLAGLVESGLTSELSVEQALDEAYEAYLANMKAAGRAPHTADELWDQMRRIRQEVADELDTR